MQFRESRAGAIGYLRQSRACRAKRGDPDHDNDDEDNENNV